MIAQFPVTTGSQHDPLPIGEWTIKGVSRNPDFHYNPDLFWDASSKDEKAVLKPGPNGPVGVVWIDLSKGLGCPVGAVLAGSADFIHNARRFKHQFGGAMRQAGIIAAAGVYALENNVERMAEDHANARKLAEGIANTEGLSLEFGLPQTNMVYFSVAEDRMTAQELHEKLWANHGIRVGVSGAQRFRAVTHIDISAADVDEALSSLNAVMVN